MPTNVRHCRFCGERVQFIQTAASRGSVQKKFHICELQRRTVVTNEGQVVTGYEDHHAHCNKRGADKT